jgi:hypothetical protein
MVSRTHPPRGLKESNTDNITKYFVKPIFSNKRNHNEQEGDNIHPPKSVLYISQYIQGRHNNNSIPDQKQEK